MERKEKWWFSADDNGVCVQGWGRRTWTRTMALPARVQRWTTPRGRQRTGASARPLTPTGPAHTWPACSLGTPRAERTTPSRTAPRSRTSCRPSRRTSSRPALASPSSETLAQHGIRKLLAVHSPAGPRQEEPDRHGPARQALRRGEEEEGKGEDWAGFSPATVLLARARLGRQLSCDYQMIYRFLMTFIFIVCQTCCRTVYPVLNKAAVRDVMGFYSDSRIVRIVFINVTFCLYKMCVTALHWQHTELSTDGTVRVVY